MPPHTASKSQPQASFDWHAHLDTHRAAALFPKISEAEVQELAADIQANGLRTPIVSWSAEAGGDPVLLDGVNRLDALARLGLLFATDGHLHLRSWTGTKWAELSGDRIQFQHFVGGDPFAIALSFNIHRRHLTPEKKRELIAKLVKAKPEVSDRQLGKMAKSSKNTVASVRAEMESRGQVDHVEKRTDTKGRAQPARHLGARHKCWQCGARAPVGEVQQRNYAAYEGTDVWLHDSCVAAFEAVTDAESAEASDDNTKAIFEAHPEQENAANEPKHKAVNTKDIALHEFDGHVLRLAQMICKAKPERFAKTGVPGSDLLKLGVFLADVSDAVKVAAP